MEDYYGAEGSIGSGLRERRALRDPEAFMREFGLPLRRVPRPWRRVKMFGAAFALATAAFFATMATMPPTTEAGAPPLSHGALQRATPMNSPTLLADAL